MKTKCPRDRGLGSNEREIRIREWSRESLIKAGHLNQLLFGTVLIRLLLFLFFFSRSTVVLGVSTIVYAAARGQDIVGRNVTFTFGWSCVTSWIATIIALLNTVITLVMICVYIDKLTERVNRVREDLGMDTLSIRSTSLQRINEHLDGLSVDEAVIDTDRMMNGHSDGHSDGIETNTLLTSLQRIDEHLDSVQSEANRTYTNEDDEQSDLVGTVETVTDDDGQRIKLHIPRNKEQSVGLGDHDDTISIRSSSLHGIDKHLNGVGAAVTDDVINVHSNGVESVENIVEGDSDKATNVKIQSYG